MFKSTIVCVSLFAVCSSESLTLQKPTWTKQIEFSQSHTVTVSVGFHLFTVSHNTSRFYVNSTDKRYKTCIFDEDSFPDNRMQVAVLGNDRRIIVWSVSHVQFYAEIAKVFYTMLLIDLRLCSHKKVPLPEDDQSRYLHRMNFDLNGWQSGLQVVTYLDSFDVFFGGSNVRSPWRFSDDGEDINVLHRLKHPGNDTYGTVFIQALDSISGIRGYFQVYQSTGRYATVKLLNSNFHFIKQIRIDHHVSKVFVNRVSINCIIFNFLQRIDTLLSRQMLETFCL